MTALDAILLGLLLFSLVGWKLHADYLKAEFDAQVYRAEFWRKRAEIYSKQLDRYKGFVKEEGP